MSPDAEIPDLGVPVMAAPVRLWARRWIDECILAGREWDITENLESPADR
jgi:hypothetical protein